MGEVVQEVEQSIINHLVDANLTTGASGNGQTTTNNTMLKHLLDLDVDKEFTSSGDFSNDPCKKILWQPVQFDGNVRLWDLFVLIPNLIFLTLLILGARNARRRLQSTNSPIFGAFYSLVVTSTVVSVFRCLVSMIVSTYSESPNTSQVATNADKLLWIIMRFFLLATEMSVVVFGVASGHLDSKRSIRVVVLVSACVSLTYSFLQCILEFHNDLDLTFDVDGGRLRVFGHGGALFWMISSLCFALLYISVVFLPVLPCKKWLSLPNKKSFYVYAGCLAILNALQWVGSLEMFCGIPSGLCLVNLTTFLYYTLFTPSVYFVFLYSFFRQMEETPPFSYKAQVDELEEEMLSNAMQFAHDDQSSAPIIISGGYLRLETDRGGQNQQTGFPRQA